MYINITALEGEFKATWITARHCSLKVMVSVGGPQPVHCLLSPIRAFCCMDYVESWHQRGGPSDTQENTGTHTWIVRFSRDLVTLSYTEKWVFLFLHLELSVREDFSFQSQSGRRLWLQRNLGVSLCMSHVSCYQDLQSFLFNRKKHEIVLERLCGCYLWSTKGRFPPRLLWNALWSFLPFAGAESGPGSESPCQIKSVFFRCWSTKFSNDCTT